VSGIRLPAESPYVRHVQHLFVIRTERPQELREYLGRHGIGTGLHYPIPLHLQRAYDWMGAGKGALPVSEEVAKSLRVVRCPQSL